MSIIDLTKNTHRNRVRPKSIRVPVARKQKHCAALITKTNDTVLAEYEASVQKKYHRMSSSIIRRYTRFRHKVLQTKRSINDSATDDASNVQILFVVSPIDSNTETKQK